jgi:TonB family protein
MTLRLTCLIFIILFISSVSFAQDCDGYIGIMTNDSGENMYAFRNPLKVLDKKNGKRVLDIDGFMLDSTLVILMNVNSGAPCINQEDDIVVRFTNGMAIKLKSAYLANCNHQAALALNERSGTSGWLEVFKSRQVSNIEIQTLENNNENKDGVKKLVAVDFSETSSLKFRDVIKCLSNYFGKKPFKTDSTYNDDESKIFVIVDKQPEYKGGIDAMVRHVHSNLSYPTSARRMGIDGIVYVSFLVSPAGILHNIKVIRGISADCDKEAIRVVALMPPWRPGRLEGKPVTVRVVLPIKFNLND